jgi:hypothetical protein
MNIMEKTKAFIKGNEKDLWLILMIIIIGILGFGLGRVSGLEKNKMPIEIVLPDFPASSANTITSGSESGLKGESQAASVSLSAKTGKYVGSVNSDKYHLPTCGGAKRISEANKVWFGSKEEAKNAGYVPAGNCPGI